jgi:hypothetical protein
VNPKNRSGKFPWITKEDFVDTTRFLIDGVLKQALLGEELELRVHIEPEESGD